MLVPIRCFNCGNLIADKWEKYNNYLNEHNNKETIDKIDNIIDIKDKQTKKSIEAEILDNLGITKYCCRNTIISTIDLTDVI